MSDCCSTNCAQEQSPKRHACPVNGKLYLEVPYSTVLQHIKEPWKLGIIDQRYYFCDAPDCDVVYFGHDNSVIRKDHLRTKLGIKETSDDALICFCFGVSKAEAKSNESIKTFVIEQTKNSQCACTSRNPSGRCCLKDFPKK